MSNVELRSRWDATMMRNYGTPPLALVRGEGCRVWDADGNAYLDLVAGIAVNTLGHAHPAIVDAVTDQVGQLGHTSNLAIHEPGVRLAERLVALSGRPARVFFSQDGATANEAAYKIARRHGWTADPTGGKLRIIAADGSFHGRTMGALSITGNAPKREPFEPLPGPVTFVPYGDADALAEVVGADTAAVFLEPILGEGGVVPPPAGYLERAREITTASDALLIVDEVQSGIGRTGAWFASAGVAPDVITLAKGLAGGLPLGAVLAFGPSGELLAPGDHGTTFGGNPVSVAAAHAVLDVLDDGLLTSVTAVGDHLAHGLEAIGDPWVAGQRGAGLWRGLLLTEPVAGAVEAAARRHGFLVNAVRPDVVRLCPPLIITPAEVDEFLAALSGILADAREEAG
ncbi:MAG: acetylornithine transaminase [Candidatus Nanopelagicales bacterium]